MLQTSLNTLESLKLFKVLSLHHLFRIFVEAKMSILCSNLRK